MTVTASAKLTYVLASPGVYDYTITLKNDASSTAGLTTFEFAGVGTQGLMVQQPTVTGSPSSWTSQVLKNAFGGGFAYGIQWSNAPGGFITEIFPGNSSSAFTFTSAETPAQMAADSPVFTTLPTSTSQVGYDVGDVQITTTVACFAAGTRIATAEGELAVEDLRVGDRVPVLLGRGTEEVVWVGQRWVDCTRHPEPRKVWPVRISAGAFGDGLPQRALFLSPYHAVYVDGALIPVKYLINGHSIAQLPAELVTYYHVELTRHEVLLAEGLPVESYLDTGDRANFGNGGGPIALHPDFSARGWDAALVWEALGCAALVVTGPRLDAVRERVADRPSKPPARSGTAPADGTTAKTGR